MTVYIITWCRDPAALYGSLLTFRTLRTGFPGADVVVIDNGTEGEPRKAIEKAARWVGADYAWRQEMPHWAILETTLARSAGPCVFVDPDVVFWKLMRLPQDCLWAGRLIPRFMDEYTGCVTQPRLHTSMLWFPNAPRFCDEARKITAKYWEAPLFRPSMHNVDGQWIRFDTGASLYGALGGRAFSDELDRYDHIFCGSHLSHVSPRIDAESRVAFESAHEIAKGDDLSPLRGLWKQQQQHFEQRKLL